MKATPTYPKITARFERIDPATATAYLATMGPNRKLKDSTVAQYANDMANGAWLLSPQGIAFDDAGVLFDGQHRLGAIVRAGLPVPVLVLRGFPARQQDLATMDAVDCGVTRSIADRLRLMTGRNLNPNLVAATVRHIVQFTMGRNRRACRKLSLSAVLAVADLWASQLAAVCKLVDRPGFTQIRKAEVVAAMTLCAAVCPNKTEKALSALVSGAGLAAGSPLLELRNAFLFGRVGDEPGDRLAACLSAILCEWLAIPGKQLFSAENRKAATTYILDRQGDRIPRLQALFHSPSQP